MKERIKELAKEHGFVRWDYDSLSYELKGDIEDLYAFAELLIRECMMLVEGFESTQEVALDEYVDYEASAVLKEHFGVEE